MLTWQASSQWLCSWVLGSGRVPLHCPCSTFPQRFSRCTGTCPKQLYAHGYKCWLVGSLLVKPLTAACLLQS